MTTNLTATAGLIFAAMAICFGWVPYLGGFLWLTGLIFSFVGLYRPPRGLAWAGIIISLVWIATYVVAGLLLNSFDSFTLYPYYLW